MFDVPFGNWEGHFRVGVKEGMCKARWSYSQGVMRVILGNRKGCTEIGHLRASNGGQPDGPKVALKAVNKVRLSKAVAGEKGLVLVATEKGHQLKGEHYVSEVVGFGYI